jgi:S1-C subfamily serine protease
MGLSRQYETESFISMRRIVKLTLLALSLTCISATCVQPTAQLSEEPPQEITAPHVRVGIRPNYHGSGIVISHKSAKTFILTARHAATLCEKLENNKRCSLAVWPGDKLDPVDAIIERNAKNELDASIISTPRLSNPVAKIARKNEFARTPVFVLGSPGDPFRTIYRRRIREYGRQYNSRIRYLATELDLDGSILPGFSGGGVYNARSELVAMCVSRRREEDNRGVCIPIQALFDLIRQYTNNR